MTDSKNGLNPPVYTNAKEPNLDIERAAKRKFWNRTNRRMLHRVVRPFRRMLQSSGTTISTKLGNKNALRHGGYFRGLMPWESREEFEALHKSLQEDCKPDEGLKEQVVLSLTQWTWK